MIAILDAYYGETHTSVACLVAAGWSDGTPLIEHVRLFPQAQPYVPGQFYRRELPFLLLALTGLLTASERVHRILPLAMLALFMAMVVLTSLRPG